MYIWNSRKAKRNVHILNKETGKTWCKLENSNAGRRLDARDEFSFPNGRDICHLCLNLKANPSGNEAKRDRKGDTDFYRSWQWAKLRFEVLKAYGAICMCCRSTENIVVDHIKPRRRFPELQMDFDNLQVLCDFCNRGKSGDDETDFRPKKPEPELPEDQMEHLKSIQ